MYRNGTHPMARINYAIRAASFGYSFLVLAIHGLERGYGPLFWLALVLQFLIYPHLAYLHALQKDDNPPAPYEVVAAGRTLPAHGFQLAGALRARRPDIDMGGWQQETMTGALFPTTLPALSVAATT